MKETFKIYGEIINTPEDAQQVSQVWKDFEDMYDRDMEVNLLSYSKRNCFSYPCIVESIIIDRKYASDTDFQVTQTPAHVPCKDLV